MTDHDAQMGIYTDEETGRRISTHSMLKTFRRCPKQAEYKYIRRLKPKVAGKPLEQGKWMHKLQEVHYLGGDWKEEHARWCAKYSDLFDEEKEMLGDLPTECAHMMKSYLWHYQADEWKVLDVEFVLEVELPDGTIYRAKIDLLIEDQFGLWIVDHKWNKSLPNLEFRIIDSQSALYVWAAIKSGIPVLGHIWNYGRRKPPTVPDLLKDGSRLSRWWNIETDYITLKSAIKHYGLDPEPYKALLRQLKRQRYVPGEMQQSPFFRRNIIERSPEMLKQVAREAHHTSKRMHSYPFEKSEFVERVPDRSCSYMCSYTDICTMELFAGANANLQPVLKRFRVADPMDYYYDEKDWGEDGRAR